MRHASDQIIKAVAYATAFQEKSRKISVGNHLQHFVGLLTRISQCGQPHPRICFAFPAKPLQPASDLLLQKKTDTLCSQLQNPRPEGVLENVFGSFTQFPCSVECTGVSLDGERADTTKGGAKY